MKDGKITRTQDREAARHTAAILKLQRAEVKMVRAMRAWDKARLAVRRYDIKADKRFAEIPGKLDIRDLPGAVDRFADDEIGRLEPFARPSANNPYRGA